MIQIYCGDGKGKTSAAMGLAVRGAGRGRGVLIAQFLKSDNSGERSVMATIPGITLLDVPEKIKFVFDMEDKEQEAEKERQTALFQEAAAIADRGDCTMLVLDEMCSAVSTGMVPLKLVTKFLDRCPPELEIIMTGWNPAPELILRADYITEMKKVKHPYDKGTPARLGIEW